MGQLPEWRPGSVNQLPFHLPAGALTPQVEILAAPEGLTVSPSGGRSILLNGVPTTRPVVISDTVTLQLDDTLLVLNPSEEDTFEEVRTDAWMLFDATSGELLGEFAPQDLLDRATEFGRAPNTSPVPPAGSRSASRSRWPRRCFRRAKKPPPPRAARCSPPNKTAGRTSAPSAGRGSTPATP